MPQADRCAVFSYPRTCTLPELLYDVFGAGKEPTSVWRTGKFSRPCVLAALSIMSLLSMNIGPAYSSNRDSFAPSWHSFYLLQYLREDLRLGTPQLALCEYESKTFLAVFIKTSPPPATTITSPPISPQPWNPSHGTTCDICPRCLNDHPRPTLFNLLSSLLSSALLPLNMGIMTR